MRYIYPVLFSALFILCSWAGGSSEPWRVDTDDDGTVDQWTPWQQVKETYDYKEGFAKHVTRTPAKLNLSDLPEGYAFKFEFRTDKASKKDIKPEIDSVTMEFEQVQQTQSKPGDPFIAFQDRGSLENAKRIFENTRKGRVAFMGGSITNMKGWREMVCNYVKDKFPDTDIECINAGLPSTGSVPGAFRFSKDVLSHGKIDLLFEEAAVNDAGNGRSSAQQLRGMEGIIRQARMQNPEMDIMMMHFADPEKVALYNQGQTPEVIQNHEKAAEYYQVSSLNLAKEVQQRIKDGQFSWEDDFRNLHPSPFGQKLYFQSIKKILENAWANVQGDQTKQYALPEKPLEPASYFRGELKPVTHNQAGRGFQLVQRWSPENSAGTREGFVNVPVLEAEKAGATLHYSFKGKAIGLFVVSGPDAGMIEYKIDEGPWQSLDLFTKWSQNLHLPWLYILNDQLKNTTHQLRVKIKDTQNPLSKGNACRIVYFAINH